MSLELGFMYLIALGKGDVKFPHIVQVDQAQPDFSYSGYPTGNPFDFGFTSPLETAPGTPLYGLENVGEPIDAPFFLGYSERPQATNYVPLDLEIRNLLGGGL